MVFYDMQDIRLASTVLKNFYNYLLHHNVCPEFGNDILAARDVCNLAEVEFLKVTGTAKNLPGDFNVACSTLFDGFYKDKYVRIGDWDEVEAPELRGKFAAHTKEKSNIIFKTGVGALGTDEQIEACEKGVDHITCTSAADGVGIEVTKVELPSPEVLELYAALNAQTKGRLALEPLGKLHCKHWDIPDFGSDDLPAWRLEEIARGKAEKRYEFWLEAAILQSCFVGMKMQVCVRTLSLGIQCLDQVQEVYCSFYTYLPNELMFKWREPRFNNDGADEQLKQTTDGSDDDDAE